MFVRAVNAAGLMETSAPVNISAGENPGAGPGATASPVMPVATATPAIEANEPMEISLMAGEGRVAASTPVVLRFGWEADTAQQVADFLAAAELVASLDGVPLPDSAQYWSEVEETGNRDANGEPNYQTFWRYPLGVLTPETHQVEAELRFQRPVTDGFDTDGNGEPEEYSETIPFSLQIVVGE